MNLLGEFLMGNRRPVPVGFEAQGGGPVMAVPLDRFEIELVQCARRIAPWRAGAQRAALYGTTGGSTTVNVTNSEASAVLTACTRPVPAVTPVTTPV